jgi:hypothetical protein
MEPIEVTDARTLFAAYNEQGPNPWKTWDGKDVPRWDDLNAQVQAKWVAVAVAAVELSEPRTATRGSPALTRL